MTLMEVWGAQAGKTGMATMEKVPMLAEGYERLTADLKVLRAERPKIVDAIEEARAHGDLSENAEYHAAKERQGQVEAQIAELEDKVSRAQIIDPSTLSGDKVIFGATVTLLDEDDKPVKYQIVGQTEADATQGRLSYTSPIARALIGKQVGDEIEVTVPSGEKFYLVEKIEFI
jgi:transcription elongation factor GreA